jgi:hypothetical protein
MTTYEEVSLWVTGAGSLFVFIGLWIAAKQISENTRSHRENHDWNRRYAAQQALVEGRDELEVKRQIEASFEVVKEQRRLPIEFILAKFEQDKALIVALHRLLNIYEGYARGITQRIYDDDVIKAGRKTVMIRTFDIFHEYIAYRRKIGSVEAWMELEAITDQWRYEDTRLTYRKPTA